MNYTMLQCPQQLTSKLKTSKYPCFLVKNLNSDSLDEVIKNGQGIPGNETGNQVQYELIAVKLAHNYSLRELCTQ